MTIDRTLLSSLALAFAIAVAGVSVYQPPAMAQEDEDEKKEGAKKKNGNGNGEGEESKEEEEGWTFKAKLNRPMMLWNDGPGGFTPTPGGLGNQRTRGARFVDGEQDNSGAEAEYKFKIIEGWTGTLKFGVDATYAKQDTVSQFDRDGNGTEVKLNDTLFELGHEKYGKWSVGLQDSASDGTSDINLSGSNVVADAEVNNWNNDFFLRAAGRGLINVRWGEFFAGPDVGDSGSYIKYTTPKFMGFEASVSVGQPLDIRLFTPQEGRSGPLVTEDHDNGLQTDFGLRYSQKFGDAFVVKAGLGLFKNSAEERDAEEPLRDTGVGGSFAVRHLPTGLNFAVNAATLKHTETCRELGAVSRGCRGPDTFVYLKAGVVRDYFGWGNTAFYGEYYKGWRKQNLSDDEFLRSLELNPDQAVELASSVMDVWGLGISQTIDPTSTRHYATDLYVGYRQYSVDVSLLGADGAAVPTRPINDFRALMAGVRLRFGKIEKDEDLED
jgi:hypothetical protein